MAFLKSLEFIYRIAVLVFVLYYSIWSFFDKSWDDSPPKKESVPLSSAAKYSNARVVVGCVFFIALLLYAFFFKETILTYLLLIGTRIAYVIGAYFSIKTIINIVLSPKRGTTGFHEKYAVLTITNLITLFVKIEKLEILFAWMKSFLNNASFEVLRIVVMSFACFFYVFFICVLLIIPGIVIWNNLGKLVQRLSAKLSTFYRRVVKSTKPFESEQKSLLFPVLNKLTSRFRNRQYLRMLFLGISIPFAILFDFAWTCLKIAFFAIIVTPFKGALILIKLLKDSFLKMCALIGSQSDKMIIAFSFRLSIIVALVFIVVLNRYNGLFSNTNSDQNTAVLEFIASSIIIPVVFDWIYSLKTSKKGKKEVD